jgi:uncharacterized membrane protein
LTTTRVFGEWSPADFAEETMATSGANDKPSVLPPHVEGTVQAIAQLYVEHHQQASPVERAIDSATSIIGRPLFLGVLVVFVVLWIAINLTIPSLGHPAFDPPPF